MSVKTIHKPHPKEGECSLANVLHCWHFGNGDKGEPLMAFEMRAS